jgi:hypothetical protein
VKGRSGSLTIAVPSLLPADMGLPVSLSRQEV